MSPQLPLALRFPPDQRFDGFVGDDGICRALAALAAGESSAGMYLAGPAGSGKSHLLLAACAEAERLGRHAAYLPLAALAGRLADALPGHESTALVCLDGLEAVAGRLEDEVALFHFHNRAREAGAALLYAANSAPAGLPLVLPDLASRLGQCTRLTLDVLDDEGRREVLRRRAARRGLELEPAVLDYVLRRVGRDLGTLTALLDRVDRASLAAQRRLTVPFLRALLEAPAGE